MAKKQKKVVVDSKWLRDVAKLIHDGHSGKYLRLCTGTLQNGPDPVDSVRTMHCGLGELYFQLTGRQPEEDGVNEDDVVSECLDRTVLADPDAKADELDLQLRKTLTKELKAIKAVKLDEYAIADIVDTAVSTAVDAARDEAEEKAQEFRDVLNQIPDINDLTGASTQDEGAVCSMGDFKARSKAVAALLREAAALLP